MEVGNIKQIDIDQEMRSSYIDYAMSVIVSRALPDARDGLKPVHRRILYAMMDMGLRSNTPYKKSARIVGEVLGKYHPHGDQAVYESMARMAQDFSLRYMLVDGQGNFGSVDGDSPAAMRYTEARMDIMAEEMVADIDKDTVDFIDNFDGSLQEPTVLPARLPNMLLNGSSGIAVGMATNIPSHNIKEVCKALRFMIENQDTIDDVTIEDIMKYIPGPDFATGGIIVGTEGIRQGYSTGKGKITVRGRAQIEELRGNRYQIRVTEIPYQVNKTTLIERIAGLVRSGKLSEISDLRDESDRNGMRIIIELKRNSQPKRVLNRLYKFTQLQTTFGINMLALVDGEPRLLPLKRSLQIFIDHRVDVIDRRSQFELEKAKNRAHILEGLLIALANLDEVIKTIRESKDANVAKRNLIERFNLTSIQAQAILDMQLRRLSQLEQEKIEAEHKELLERIAYLEDLLAHPAKVLQLINEDLKEISKKYGDDRRTLIVEGNAEDLTDEDLVSDVAALVTITRNNYIKRVSPRVYRTQHRGGKGVIGQNVKDEDQIDILIPCRALHTLLFFSDRGKVYSERVFELNESGRTDKGMPIVNILALEPNERITAAVAVPDFDAAEFITLATVKGRIKRMPLSELRSVRMSGLIAVNLNEGDRLGWAQLTHGNDEIIMITAGGNALRVKESCIRSMGRGAAGVIGIKLDPDDRLTSMEIVKPKAYLLVVTEKGYGKRTALKNFRTQGRATKGVTTIDKKAIGKIGKIACARVVSKGDQVTLISNNGIMLRLNVDKISSTGRNTKGVHLMKLDEGDQVASIGRISDARK
ncbi:MAG: DNA gyrase subunit A [Anaerolineaceae bacterium]|nr:DNA gyrase subunit A [Anaerolineaceae bacterium]